MARWHSPHAPVSFAIQVSVGFVNPVAFLRQMLRQVPSRLEWRTLGVVAPWTGNVVERVEVDMVVGILEGM